MFRRFTALIVTLSFVLLLAGCETFSQYERAQYETIKAELDRTGLPDVREKSPLLASVMNLGPGLGNIYLDQWGQFIGNLITWPLSPLWSITQAAVDANNINKKRTLYYYSVGPGKDQLEAAL